MRICQFCKNVFLKPSKESYRRWEKRKFCSHYCANTFNKTKLQSGNLPNTGKKFNIEWKLKISKATSNWQKGRNGKMSNNWQGGKTSESKRLRNSNLFAEWRNKVFKRDDFICQKCGQKGGKLHSHHIKKWSKFPTLRFDVGNGMTVCISCHSLLHRRLICV